MKTFDSNSLQLGEGPLWHPLRQELLWFDIRGRTLYAKSPKADASLKSWSFDEFVSAAGWIDENRILIATQTSLSQFTLATGALEKIEPLEAENPITRSNDGRADPFGGFWIGTMGIKLEPKAGAIYRYYRGELRQLYDNITVSNAICFAPNGEYAHFTDSREKIIWKVALDSKGWPSGDPEMFIDLKDRNWNPDGAVIDSSGTLWIAAFEGGAVFGFDSFGVESARIDCPARQVTCPAFGGEDLCTLFATTARERMEPNAAPIHGQTYMSQTQTPGQAEHPIEL